MTGQLSLFDLHEKKRPCDYGFQRYIGQRVGTRDHGLCTITKIDTYYTDIRSTKGERLVGTPYDIWPAKCENCEHYQMTTAGYMACFGFTISPSVKPDDVCGEWKMKEENE